MKDSDVLDGEISSPTNKWITGCAWIGLSGTIALGATWYYFQRLTENAYVLGDAAKIVIQYMDLHDGSWPSSWQVLEDEIEAGRIIRSFPYVDVRDRVTIDFDIEPSTLSKMDFQDGRAPFQVIRLKAWPRGNWSDSEPNTMILKYLKLGEKQF